MIVWDWLLGQSQKSSLSDEFLFFTITTMENYEIYYQEQFRKCQATEVMWEDDEWNVIVIFYSYQCPELVKVRGSRYRFSFEGSRKAWEKTGSRTTSKQLTNYYWSSWRDLPVMNLKTFEDEYFSTAIDWLY